MLNKILNKHLAERSAKDLFELQDYLDGNDNKSPAHNVFISAITVKQSLRSAYDRFNIIKKFFTYFSYHKSEKWIMEKLSLNELNQVCEDILKLEGVDTESIKKKLNQ